MFVHMGDYYNEPYVPLVRMLIMIHCFTPVPLHACYL
jgi:hypothetical protein